MVYTETQAQQQAETDYANALAQLAQPDQPALTAPADPYGRTLTLTGGDFVIGPGTTDGTPDLAIIVGTDELAQGIQVLVGTNLGSDIFNVVFGFDLINTMALPNTMAQMRNLIKLCVVKALSQEPRIRQVLAIAFVDEPAYLTIYPQITVAQQQALAQQQRVSRQWSLGVQLDTRLNDQITAGIQGVGP
jgi:phage baseplate assembly protein W